MGSVFSSCTKEEKGAASDKVSGFHAAYNLSYKPCDKLGEGSFATVRRATRKSDDKCFAVKCVKDSGLDEEDKAALKIEVQILKDMNHPNVMNLIDYYCEESDSKGKHHYLVTELLQDELFDRIVQKEFYTEKEACDLVRLLLDAILYIHSKGVVHRDLKPENLLMTSRSDDASIKIADFGFAKQVKFPT